MEKIKEIETDNNEASEWVKVEGLYRLLVIIDDYLGHPNVVMDIFRYNTDRVPFNPEKYVPDCIPKDIIKEESSDVLKHLKESFTFEEIGQIRGYFSKLDFIIASKLKSCSLPRDGRIWTTGAHRSDGIRGPKGFIVFCKSKKYLTGVHPSDGAYGPRNFIVFYKSKNYPLPFDIAGYYNIWDNLPFNTDEITD